MNETKKLTEAALLSSLFIVATIVIVGTGFGYMLYLDFIVPVFFCSICIKCDIKYTLLSALSSLLIIFLVLGNIGTAIWASQSIILGITCGFMMKKSTTVLDDILCSSIIGVIIMIFVDVYASKLIGYSFMKEFQGYMKYVPIREFADIAYYLMISLFVLGTVFSIYILSLMLCNKINILKSNSKKKFLVIRNFRSCGRFLCCSKNIFYLSVVYIFIIEIIRLFNIDYSLVYLKTSIICSEYICIYFVMRDSFTSIQNFIMAKYKKIIYPRVLGISIMILFFVNLKLTTIGLAISNIILDRKINIIIKQIDIINSYTYALATKK